MMFRMVTLYAVRGRWDGRDIVEGTHVTVKTKDGREMFGILQDVGYEHITVYDFDNEATHYITYDAIDDISD